MSAFKKVLEAAPPEVMQVTRATLTVKDRMSVIIDTLQGTETLRFEELFKDDFTRSHLVVTFVALLELLRLGLARTYQEREFGAIWIIRPEHEPQAGAGAEPAGAQTPETPPAF
jgi:segregation and condensation protein A